MKNLFLGFLLLQFFVLDAQKITYKEKKELFPAKGYKTQKGDKYDPTTATLLSFLIPGVGQMYAGEPGRGVVQLLTTSAFAAIFISGVNANNSGEIVCNGSTCTTEGNGSGTAGVLIGLLGVLGTSISSMVDANQVAKVNSQYEKSKSEKAVEISPNIGFITTQGESIPTVGLVVRF